MLCSQYTAQPDLSILTYQKHFVTDRAVTVNSKKNHVKATEVPWEEAELQHQESRANVKSALPFRACLPKHSSQNRLSREKMFYIIIIIMVHLIYYHTHLNKRT